MTGQSSRDNILELTHDALAYLATVEDALARVESLDAELDGVLATARKLSASEYTAVPGGPHAYMLVADAARRRAAAVSDAVKGRA